jgi:NTP pyrophosphatase (non-canonical NTP hydrolase)
MKAADLEFCSELRDEVARARAKFPHQPLDKTMYALFEEAGEVAKALNEEEPAHRVRAELVQVAAMALRVAVDCLLDSYDDERGAA